MDVLRFMNNHISEIGLATTARIHASKNQQDICQKDRSVATIIETSSEIRNVGPIKPKNLCEKV